MPLDPSPIQPAPVEPSPTALVVAEPSRHKSRRSRRRSRRRPPSDGVPVGLWVAAGVAGVLGVGALASTRTGRRLATTAWVGAKAWGTESWSRAGGAESDGPAVVRRAFEDLGPAYVKH